MTEFHRIWPDLVEKADELAYVETFRQGNRNDIRYEEPNDAICFNSRDTAEEYWTDIPRERWRVAWERLQERGELRPSEFFEATSIRRGSTAVPFLQVAHNLPADVDDRVVYLPEDEFDSR